MRSLFTVHAGEFLVGSEIERRIRGANVWLPAKDTGIDLLVTNSRNTRSVALQVKYSRDYSMFHKGAFVACGWWTLDRKKIHSSRADLWVFVLLPFDVSRSLDYKKMHYVIIPPRELGRRLKRIHGSTRRIQSYLWVTPHKKCWEARGLSKDEEILMAGNRYSEKKRDLTPYLDAWELVARRLR